MVNPAARWRGVGGEPAVSEERIGIYNVDPTAGYPSIVAEDLAVLDRGREVPVHRVAVLDAIADEDPGAGTGVDPAVSDREAIDITKSRDIQTSHHIVAVDHRGIVLPITLTGAGFGAVKAAQATLDSARAKLSAMKKGARDEDIRVLQANLEAADAKRDYLQEHYQRCFLAIRRPMTVS